MMSLIDACKQFWRDKRGSVAIIFALKGMLAVTVVAFALHYGAWSREKTALQAATDAAALAGTRELIYAMADPNNQSSTGETDEAAKAYFKANGFAEVPSVNATTSAPYSVTVSAMRTGEVWIGPKVISKSPEIAATATARGIPEADACVLALDVDAPMGIDFNLSGTVTASDCSIWSNSTTNNSYDANGSGTITAAANCAVGNAKVTGNITLNPPVKTGCFPATDPMAGWSFIVPSGCDYNNYNIPTVTTGTGKSSTTTGTLVANKVYCGNLTWNGGTLRMPPGVYYIKNGTFKVSGNASVVGPDPGPPVPGVNEGVTIVLLEGGTLDFAGTGYVDLKAPRTGAFTGMVIVSDRNGSVQNSKIAGNNYVNLEGQVYLPNQNLTYAGNSSGVAPTPAAYHAVIAKTITFNGSPTVKFNIPPGFEIPGRAKTYRSIVLVK